MALASNSSKSNIEAKIFHHAGRVLTCIARGISFLRKVFCASPACKMAFMLGALIGIVFIFFQDGKNPSQLLLEEMK